MMSMSAKNNISKWTVHKLSKWLTISILSVWFLLLTLKAYSWVKFTNWLLPFLKRIARKTMRTRKLRTLTSREFPPWWLISSADSSMTPWRGRRRETMSQLRVPDIRVLGLLDGDVSNTAPGGRLAYSAPSAKLHGLAPALLLVPHSPSAPRRRHSWICRYLCCYCHKVKFVFLRRYAIGKT